MNSGKKVHLALCAAMVFLLAPAGLWADTVLFEDHFPSAGSEEAWVATTFALGSDPASPDGDGAVYEATDPGSLKSAKSEATFVDAYPLILTAMVRICDPVSSWASTQVGFASDGGREFFVQCHGHVPNLFQLFRSVSGPELITEIDTTGTLALSSGDWVELRLELRFTEVCLSVRKWLGSSWSATVTSGPLPDGTAPLMQAWRVSLACWEDAGENTVHRVDGIRVTTEPFTEEGFPASGPEQTWLCSHFSVAADNTTPDGDGSVFQQFTPGGSFMTYSGNTVVPEYPIRLTAMVRVSDPAASTWARTDVGLRADNNDQIFVLVHGQVPSLIQLAHFAPFSETLSEFDTSSQFSLAPGDWVEVSLVVDEASVLYGVRKWLGSEWTESMSGAVHDAHLTRDLRWRPVVRCDAQEGANSTHAVDRIRVEHLAGPAPFTRDRFPATGPEQGWMNALFSVAVDSTTPDGDGSVFETTNPGSHVSTLSEGVIEPTCPVSLSAMVRIPSQDASWATTRIGFRNDMGGVFIVTINGHAPSLFEFYTTQIASVPWTLQHVLDTSSAFGLVEGDWVHVRLVVEETHARLEVSKWLGSSWSKPCAHTCRETQVPRDLPWRVFLEAYEDVLEDTIHRVDDIQVCSGASCGEGGSMSLLFRDLFPSSGTEQWWQPGGFSVAADPTTPGGDGAVYQISDPGNSTSWTLDSFSNLFPLRLQAMTRVPEVAVTWAATELGFRTATGNRLMLRCCHAVTPSELQVCSNDTVLGTMTLPSGFTLTAGDWFDVRLELDRTTVQATVRKWMGSYWSEPVTSPLYEETGTPRDNEIWRPFLRAFEDATEATTHRVDSLRVSAGPYEGEAPTITGVQVIDPRTIQVTFSETLAPGANLPGHFAVSGTGLGGLSEHPDSVLMYDAHTCWLTWDHGSMTNGGDITVTVNGIAAAGGPPISTPVSGGVSGVTVAPEPDRLVLEIGSADYDEEGFVEIPVSMASATANPSTVFFDILFDPYKLRPGSVLAGAAAASAGKSLHCETIEPGRLRILIAGENQNEIAPGPLADVAFEVLFGAGEGEHLILTGATGSAAAPDAGAIAVTYRHGYVHVVSMGLSAGGTPWQAALACALIAAAILLLRRRAMLLVLVLAVGVSSPGMAEVVAGDVDRSGAVESADAGLVLQRALGRPVSGDPDVDRSGRIDAIDYQLVVNARLGLAIDTDMDGLCDLAEGNMGTDSEEVDSDGDGVEDGQELQDGSDPRFDETRTPLSISVSPAAGPAGMPLVITGLDPAEHPVATLAATIGGRLAPVRLTEEGRLLTCIPLFVDENWQFALPAGPVDVCVMKDGALLAKAEGAVAVMPSPPADDAVDQMAQALAATLASLDTMVESLALPPGVEAQYLGAVVGTLRELIVGGGPYSLETLLAQLESTPDEKRVLGAVLASSGLLGKTQEMAGLFQQGAAKTLAHAKAGRFAAKAGAADCTVMSDYGLALRMQFYALLKEFGQTVIAETGETFTMTVGMINNLVETSGYTIPGVTITNSLLAVIDFAFNKVLLGLFPANIDALTIEIPSNTVRAGDKTDATVTIQASNAPPEITLQYLISLILTGLETYGLKNTAGAAEGLREILTNIAKFYFATAQASIAAYAGEHPELNLDITLFTTVPKQCWRARILERKFLDCVSLTPEALAPVENEVNWRAPENVCTEARIYVAPSCNPECSQFDTYAGCAFGEDPTPSETLAVDVVADTVALDVTFPYLIPEYVHTQELSVRAGYRQPDGAVSWEAGIPLLLGILGATVDTQAGQTDNEGYFRTNVHPSGPGEIAIVVMAGNQAECRYAEENLRAEVVNLVGGVRVEYPNGMVVHEGPVCSTVVNKCNCEGDWGQDIQNGPDCDQADEHGFWYQGGCADPPESLAYLGVTPHYWTDYYTARISTPWGPVEIVTPVDRFECTVMGPIIYTGSIYIPVSDRYFISFQTGEDYSSTVQFQYAGASYRELQCVHLSAGTYIPFTAIVQSWDPDNVPARFSNRLMWRRDGYFIPRGSPFWHYESQPIPREYLFGPP